MKTRKTPQPSTMETLKTRIVQEARRLQSSRVAAFGTLKQVAEWIPEGTTIGQMHDAVRELARDGKVRLHPFTGARYLLMQEGGEYGLIVGAEIMLYVQAM